MAPGIRETQRRCYLSVLIDRRSANFFRFIAALLISQFSQAEISKPPPMVEILPTPVITSPATVNQTSFPVSPINRLFQLSETAIKEYRLFTPHNDNAVHYLEQVLQQEKGHPKALEMLDQIVDLYQKMAAKQLKGNYINLEKTNDYLEKSQILIDKYHIENLVKRQQTLEARQATMQTQQLKIIAIEPKMASIPAGSFRMGCVSDQGCDDNEKPVHTVHLAAFKISQTEVTFKQWDVCVRAGRCRVLSDNQWGRGKHPVIYTTWDDAQIYTRWLSQSTGRNYRLPSEAEWEYASRANTFTAYSSGPCINTNQANYDGKSGWSWLNKCGKTGKSLDKTTPVAQFPSNKFGLHDMQGNVWEWVQDCYHKTYQGAPTDGTAWERNCDQSSGSIFRILRGGAWSVGAISLRNATRYSQSPHFSAHNAGFRLVRTH